MLFAALELPQRVLHCLLEEKTAAETELVTVSLWWPGQWLQSSCQNSSESLCGYRKLMSAQLSSAKQARSRCTVLLCQGQLHCLLAMLRAAAQLARRQGLRQLQQTGAASAWVSCTVSA